MESMPITKTANQKIASRTSPLEHTHNYLTPLTDGQNPYTQHYGTPHSRIILISETPSQHNLNQDKGSERNNYLIPTAAPQCKNAP